MTDNRKAWRAALAFGALTLAIFVWNVSRGMPDCGVALPSAMLDFELATSHAEFGTVIDCAPRRAELDLHNVVDLLLFMWAYAGLLAFFALAVGVRKLLAVGLGILIVGTDFVETAILRQIAAAWPQLDASLVTPLAVAVRVKFVAIGVLMVLTAAKLQRFEGWGAKLAAALAVIGAAASAGIIFPETRALGAPGIGVAWLAMTIYAGVRTFRRSPRPAPSSAGA